MRVFGSISQSSTMKKLEEKKHSNENIEWAIKIDKTKEKTRTTKNRSTWKW